MLLIGVVPMWVLVGVVGRLLGDVVLMLVGRLLVGAMLMPMLFGSPALVRVVLVGALVLSHALIRVLHRVMVGSSFAARISPSGARAGCHCPCPPFSRALIWVS